MSSKSEITFVESFSSGSLIKYDGSLIILKFSMSSGRRNSD